MNPLLKAMLKEVSDVVAIGEAAVAKNYAAILTAVIGAGEDVPSIISNWADLKPELLALLGNPAADADLLAYAMGLVGGVDAKAKAVITASADLILMSVEKIGALIAALELPAAPAAK